MRADRLLSLVLLLRRRGRMTATELAAELECSQRTVLRDIDALSAAGVPVYPERGRYGGFALVSGYSTDLTGLTHAEATALFTAGSRASAASLGMAPALGSAMRKLIAAMPEPQRVTAERAGRRVLVQPEGWLAEPEPAGALPTVQRAVFADRKLTIRYASRGEPPRWRTVDPIGLVHAGGRWYLLATHDDADRTYRVSRIADAAVLDEPADRDPGIGLEQAWERRRNDFRARRSEVAVRARVRARYRSKLVHAALELRAEEPDTGGWLLLDLNFADQQHATTVFWHLGPDAEILTPQSLREALIDRTEQTLHRYRQRYLDR